MSRSTSLPPELSVDNRALLRASSPGATYSTASDRGWTPPLPARRRLPFCSSRSMKWGLIAQRLGRFAGDRAQIGAAVEKFRALRAEGIVGRYGHNEFVVFARGSEPEAIMLLAERLRRAVADLHMVAGREVVQNHDQHRRGVARRAVGRHFDPARGLLALAETRANEAKACGGNRVGGASVRD